MCLVLNWLPGKQVVLSPDWIARISWSRHQVEVSMTREAVKNSPAYAPSAPLERGYEEKLFQHYQRPGYW